ncbi:unnamed protein product [Diatraea saccharalis]|uniref:carbonyl reductase (NADPH) n=1 Tax=Diatraea saccharalis TaxID=40085 RepID=A0A9N9W966_9NEOP|nr:unnamed protein product [Diatraea saccharalis]
MLVSDCCLEHTVMSEKIAIVTGANKGVGFGIVRCLCKRFDGVVYLTSRDEARGKQAVAVLEKEGFSPRYHQLDVADISSVAKFRDFVEKNHGGIDIIINNAGVAPGTDENTYELSKSVIDINYGSIVNVEELLFPLLRENARVLHISSDCGHLSNVRNKEWIERLSKKDLTRKDINDFVEWYLDSVKKGTFKQSDFADNGTIPSYRVSKVAMSALTIVQQRELEPRGIIVNSMHPGLVSTDMTTGIGFYSIDDAARTPVYLVLEAPPTIKGAYVWHDRTVVDWYDYKANYYFKRNSIFIQLIKNTFSKIHIPLIPSTWLLSNSISPALAFVVKHISETFSANKSTCTTYGMIDRARE